MKIVKLNGNQEFTWFDSKMNMIAHCFPRGWAIKTDSGFVSFDGHMPYMPKGGKKALQSIIEAGGFTGEMKTVNPKLA